ncbi:uncharacterized protein LOC117224841 [Megalopta genalis]|uniref:uncharacterized protein LOC117224841 n=1 Tax=Megalopta genalis TaxID=115081 RepID=UPI003FD35C8A
MLSAPMAAERLFLRELFLADIAGERLLAGMVEKMYLQAAEPAEVFLADGTCVRFPVVMHQHVCREFVIPDQFTTLRTRDGGPPRDVRVPFHVSVQGHLGLQDAAADETLRDEVVQFHVMGQVALHLELPRADLADVRVLVGVLAKNVFRQCPAVLGLEVALGARVLCGRTRYKRCTDTCTTSCGCGDWTSGRTPCRNGRNTEACSPFHCTASALDSTESLRILRRSRLSS